MDHITVFECLKKEFSVNDKGVGYTTKRALGSMSGIKYQSWGRYGYYFTKELDTYICEEFNLICSDSQNGVNIPNFLFNYLSSKGFIVTAKSKHMLQDTLATLVIEFYAFVQKNTIAKSSYRAISTIGLRTVIQETVNWQKEEKSNEYNFFILPEPTVWVKRFPDKLYDQFARLTGLSWDKKTHQCPPYFAKLTNAFVYKYLPSDAYKLLKENQKAIDKGVKLHQFLNNNALMSLEHHLETVLTILIASSSIREAKRLLNQAMTKNYQLSIFK
jgi:P63C domain